MPRLAALGHALRRLEADDLRDGIEKLLVWRGGSSIGPSIAFMVSVWRYSRTR
jgi:hypothetical protein